MMTLFGKKKEEPLEGFKSSFQDIPAIVGSGLPQLRRARYLLVQVDDAQAARAWLRELLASDVVHSLARVRGKAPPKKAKKGAAATAVAKPSRDVKESVTVAFSHAGLQALGLKEDADYPFPTPFRAGMASLMRRQLLGEPKEPWQWGDVREEDEFQTHIFVAHYWSEHEVAQPLALLDPAQLPAGLCARSVASCPSYIAARHSANPAVYEPFGFRDGIGQPVLEGMGWSKAEAAARKASGPLFDDRMVKPGEFVLGQVNQYGERAYCSNVEGWPGEKSPTTGFTRNGTYLAVRQIAQDVATFSRFTANHALPQLGSLMVGRRKPDPAVPAEAGYSVLSDARPPSEIDAFRYLAPDANGFQCPRGAHARRANPRDALASGVQDGIDSSKLHRILRRGRVYAEACSEGVDFAACSGHEKGREGETPCGRGLMFVALNTDFERQFEFVQKSWIAGSRFGDLRDEQDPLLGTSTDRAFSVQGCPVGERITNLPRFTTVLGGGYFFAPSLSALNWLAQERS
ncbi:MAG TPA: hypothetical protein VLJ19_03680 [Variovorax sp.]|nr:hypothetical protein [Variovorax sp.]